MSAKSRAAITSWVVPAAVLIAAVPMHARAQMVSPMIKNRAATFMTMQRRVALDFLSHLEGGDVGRAYSMLDPSVRRSFSMSQLGASAPTREQLVANVRRVTFEGNASGPQQSKGRPMQTAPYIVCVIYAPKSGYGPVTYVPITLVPAGPRGGWAVSGYRMQSEPHRACPA